MNVKTFEQFIQEAKTYENPKYNLWSDSDDTNEIENDDELIYSQADIKSSNCKFNSLKNIFKQWTGEELVSKDNFHFVCELKGEDEELFMHNRMKDYNIYSKINGIDYIITCIINNIEFIFKIGMSRKTWEERLQSYNCGKKKYRENKGTNSTTNYKVLQTICHIQKHNPETVFNLYLYGDGDDTEVIWKGINAGYSSPDQRIPIAVEHILISLCKKSCNKIPIGNNQHNIVGSKEITRN